MGVFDSRGGGFLAGCCRYCCCVVEGGVKSVPRVELFLALALKSRYLVGFSRDWLRWFGVRLV